MLVQVWTIFLTNLNRFLIIDLGHVIIYRILDYSNSKSERFLTKHYRITSICIKGALSKSGCFQTLSSRSAFIMP